MPGLLQPRKNRPPSGPMGQYPIGAGGQNGRPQTGFRTATGGRTSAASQSRALKTPGAVANPARQIGGSGGVPPARPVVNSTDARQRAAQQAAQQAWDRKYGRGQGVPINNAPAARPTGITPPAAGVMPAPATPGPLDYRADPGYQFNMAELRQRYATDLAGLERQQAEYTPLRARDLNDLRRGYDRSQYDQNASLAARGVYQSGGRVQMDQDLGRQYDRGVTDITSQYDLTDEFNALRLGQTNEVEALDRQARFDYPGANPAAPVAVSPKAAAAVLPPGIEAAAPPKRGFFMYKGNRYFNNPGAKVPIARAPK